MIVPLKNSIGFSINKTANKLNRNYVLMLKKYNIAPEQRAILELLKSNENINQSDIASELAKDKTTISRAITALEKKDFIVKKQNPQNKKVSLIRLSAKGEKVLQDSADIVYDFRKSINSRLSNEECELLNILLEKVSKDL